MNDIIVRAWFGVEVGLIHSLNHSPVLKWIFFMLLILYVDYICDGLVLEYILVMVQGLYVA
jgi:hypothetical protein